MPRSRQIETEQDRARSMEHGSTRPDAKTGTGPKPRERKGFGSEKGMQSNPKRPAKMNEF
jgi:hypothetical protein